MIQLVIISLSVLPILCNLRFKDMEQLKQHHNHINPSNQLLIVHMIPHSHDDVGWLKTVEQYFNGLRNDIQKANVEYVIDSYFEELQKDPSRKFIQVETKFFKMWWDRQTEETRQITKLLVANGQLEFISGGWCMNDEATPYYEDIIDQMTLGHKFLLDTFNVVPTIGWQIDPFGHQNTQAALSYQMGFDAWFFARIDFEDKNQRLESKNMEMIMEPPAEGVQYPIFTHVQYYHYEAPPGYNFDTYRSYDAIVDDPTSLSYNVAAKSTALVNYFKSQALHYKSNHLIHTFGSDFLWTDAKIFYKNLDKLIKYVNEHPEYNMQLKYSTPSEYIKAVNEQNHQFSLKQDDFFPYSDNPHAFWTGYFTSRVAIKGYVKRLGRQAQVYKKFLALMTYHNFIDYETATKSVESLDDALAICQHHDAVSGTEQQHVNDDYMRMLSVGEGDIKQTMHNLLSNLLYNQTTEFEQCEYNQTAQSCIHTYNALKLNKTITITVIDGKVKQTNQIDIIRLKVPNLKYLIKDQNNNIIIGDIDCTNGFQDCDLYFKYTIIENNVITYYTITPVTYGESASEIKMTINPFIYTDDTFISLNSTKQFKLKYAYYNSYQGKDQPEGAYIFRTANNNKTTYGKIIYSAIGYGRIMSVFRVSRTYTKTLIRHFYHQNDTYDIQTYLDYIPVNDEQGKDIVMVIDIANFTNNQTFYTDSNGLQFQQRILNHRPQYNWSMHELVAGNYYPINGAIYIQDKDDCVALLNDRSQGGTSLQDGQIEIMIHRRLLLDDYRGVGEALNEQEPDGDGLSQIVQHQLTFFNQNQDPNRIRKLQYYMDLKPLVFLSTETNKPNIPNNLNWFNPFQGFNIDPLLFFGDNLLKFTYFNWNDGQYILRVQNMQEKYSMKIDKLAFQNEAIRTTLTGNQKWEDWKNNSLKWNYTKSGRVSEDLDDILYPLQIQTYIISEKVIKQ